MKTKLTITIDTEILADFRGVCRAEGFKMSTKIERLVDEFVKSRR